MKNKEIRSIAKEKMKGKMGKAIGITVLYWLIIFGGTLVLNLIPIIGALIASILSVPLAFGWTKQLIELENDQNVGLLDFLSHGFANFGKVWCSNLWIFLKALGFIIAIIIGTALAFISEVVSIIIVVIAAIAMIIVMYKYIMINYTIAYDNSNLRAKDLVAKSATEAKGKVWKFICMGLYYGLLVFAVYFLGAIVSGVVIGLIPILSLIVMPAYIIGLIVAALYLSMQSIAACNEYYKINVLGNDSSINMNQNNYGYDSNQNNFGSAIDINNNGQSDDYFNN